MKDIDIYIKDLDEIDKFIDSVIYQCLSHASLDIKNLLRNVGERQYSLIMRHVDKDNDDLKYLVQEIFSCLGSPVIDINNTIISLDNLLARMCELKTEVEIFKNKVEDI